MQRDKLRKCLGFSLFDVTLSSAHKSRAKVVLPFSAANKDELIDYLDAQLATVEPVETAEGRLHAFTPRSVTWCKIAQLDGPGPAGVRAADWPKLDWPYRDPEYRSPAYLFRPSAQYLAAIYGNRRYTDVPRSLLGAEEPGGAKKPYRVYEEHGCGTSYDENRLLFFG